MPSHDKRDFVGVIKLKVLREEIILDYPGGPVSSQGPHKRETGDAALLAVRWRRGRLRRDAGSPCTVDWASPEPPGETSPAAPI